MWQKILVLLNKTVTSFKVGSFNIDATYWLVGVLILLLFMIVFTFARIRFLYVNWSMGKQTIAFLFWGFILAVGVEGLFMLYGRTIFTEVLGIESAPKPISTILDIGRSRFVKVLGTQNSGTSLDSKNPVSADQVYSVYTKLSQKEAEKFTDLICKP
ncbi:MAG TPA: hypothetical protein VI819_02160 [Patescibacteria group bacterium]|nr:hypothetical protein [Patescibacteria group bacterium]